MMSLRDGIVIRIMTGRDLQRAGAKFHADIFVRNDRNLTSEHRHDDGLADIFFITLIIRMNSHSSITENRFRANRRNGNKFARIP